MAVQLAGSLLAKRLRRLLDVASSAVVRGGILKSEKLLELSIKPLAILRRKRRLSGGLAIASQEFLESRANAVINFRTAADTDGRGVTIAIEPLLRRLEAFPTRNLGGQIDFLPFWMARFFAELVDLAEELLNEFSSFR
ncbi:MAG: hypothetical protein HC850_07100 [Rhodomicrobium sp.]|nr:hypothetical protein [Rhodomicrobium sp.]